MSRKIFIDGGAFTGISIDLFRKQWKDHNEYEIYSFECNPIFEQQIKNRNVNFINKAIWIKDEELKFYLGTRYGGMGSSLIEKKTSGRLDKQNPIKVNAIDFSQWIIDNFSKDDYIVLKLDIEGAEYEVLNKMMDDESIKYINDFYGEWHQQKIGLSKDEHRRIIGRLEEYGLGDMKYWNAEDPDGNKANGVED